MPQSEVCSICGQLCNPALYRRKPNGTTEALCENCAEKWLDSDENWPENTEKESSSSIRRTYKSA